MITAVTLFESPIDAMYVIHHALRAEAARVEQVAGQLLEGSTSQPFRRAFYRWTMALAYHADTEDAYMTARFPDTPAARECELAHQRLADRLEAVQHCLTAVSAGTSEGEPGCRSTPQTITRPRRMGPRPPRFQRGWT